MPHEVRVIFLLLPSGGFPTVSADESKSSTSEWPDCDSSGHLTLIICIARDTPPCTTHNCVHGPQRDDVDLAFDAVHQSC